MGGTASGPPTSGTFAVSDFIIDQNGVEWVCRTAGTPGTWCVAGDQPWQFRPEAYGALGNGKVIGDGVINGTTTFTSASAGFTAADTGKTIMINGGQGTTSAPLITTITFVNATTVTLGTAATATATGCAAIYGSDDTTAINNMVAAMKTYALANNYKAQALFGAKYYCLASGPTQVGNGTSTPTFNAQIPVPYPNANGTTQKLIIEFVGVGDSSNTQYWQSTIPSLHGTCLVSMVLAPGSGGSATFGKQSVIGGPTTSFGFTGGFANVKPVITGIMVVCPALAQQQGIDFRFVGGAYLDKSSCQAFASVLGNSPTLPNLTSNSTFTSGNSVGLYMPWETNNDDCNVGTFAVEGFTFAYAVSEHFTAQRIALLYCNVGLFVQEGTAGNIIHGISILYYSCETSNIALQSSNSVGHQIPVFIGLMDTEIINTTDIDDSNNTLTGIIHWADFERTNLVVNGAQSLKIVNDRLGPGYWSGAPAAPASGVSQQNTAWRDATIYVSSTVPITAVTVDGQATGQTAAANAVIPVRVAAGHSYVITAATGTQTTKWWLD